jgi:hypothetical protein
MTVRVFTLTVLEPSLNAQSFLIEAQARIPTNEGLLPWTCPTLTVRILGAS